MSCPFTFLLLSGSALGVETVESLYWMEANAEPEEFGDPFDERDMDEKLP